LYNQWYNNPPTPPLKEIHPQSPQMVGFDGAKGVESHPDGGFRRERK